MMSFRPLGIERRIDVSDGAAQRTESILCKLAEMSRGDVLELSTLGVQAGIDG